MRDLATDMTEVAMKVSVYQFPNSTLAPYLLTDMTASLQVQYTVVNINYGLCTNMETSVRIYVRNLSKSG